MAHEPVLTWDHQGKRKLVLEASHQILLLLSEAVLLQVLVRLNRAGVTIQIVDRAMQAF